MIKFCVSIVVAAALLKPGVLPASSIDNVLAMPVTERTALADDFYDDGNWRKARKEYKILARLGSKHAQQRLSEMTLEGNGFSKDPVKAWAWAAMAGEVNPGRNEEYRLEIWSSLSDTDRTRAQSEYEDLYASYSELAVTTRLAVQSRWRTKFRRIGYGLLPESMIRVSSGCDMAGLGAAGGGRGSLTTVGSADCLKSMQPWFERDNMAMYQMIQFEMDRRLRGGTVTLGEFEVLEWVPEDEQEGNGN